MRVLATAAFSFSLAIFASVLLPWDGWQLAAVLALLALSGITLLLRNRLAERHPLLPKRLLLLFLAAVAGLAYAQGYTRLICQPLTEQCGEEHAFSGTVCALPQSSNTGGKVSILLDGGRGAKAIYYGDASLLEWKPGQRIQGNAYWQDAFTIDGAKSTSFSGKGVYVLLFSRGTPQVTDGELTLFTLSLRVSQLLREKAQQIWSDSSTLGFTLAELTGDKTLMDSIDQSVLNETGMAHLFAVSGLHCAFLITFLALLIPANRRRLLACVGAGVLLFYMLMVGLTPSVVRACIMQLFLLAAPIARRDSDGLTALSAALLVLLLGNPYAAGSVSLQMSFAATLGLLLCSGRIYRGITGWYKGSKKLPRVAVAFFAASFSASLGALIFTIPLTVLYFDVFVPIAPLTNLLTVPVAGWNFVAGFATLLCSFVSLPAAKLLGLACYGCVHYMLWIGTWMTKLPWHALYTNNRLLVYWLLYCYAMGIGCVVTSDRKRKYILATVLASVMLICVVKLGARQYQYGQMSAVALNVGQGESMILHSAGETVLVDCGSSNSFVDAAQTAMEQLSTMQVGELSAVIVTHYHADHTNGLYDLLRRIPVKELYLPQIEDEYGVRQRLTELAEQEGITVHYTEDETALPLGNAEVTVYPPVGKADLNEAGLSVLCRAGDFELLYTGDMAGSTEKALLEKYELPDIEVLMVSHHGSKYSSDREFLQAVLPEAAIISVGDNSYGHPSDSALARLRSSGATVYRTDTCGNILVTVN